MAPIKFEENIKDKLEKRAIEPSDLIWNKLSDKLDEHEGKPNSKIIWWIGISASLVGVFLVTTLFFNKDEKETLMPIIVETPIEDTIKLKDETPVINAVVENEKPSQKDVSNLQKESKINTVKQEVERKSLTKRNESFTPKTEVVANNVLEEEVIINEDLNNLDPINKEVNNQEIVAHIPELENDKVVVTDAEIESLLQGAQKDLAVKEISAENTKTVDASSLLQDVEIDLEKSFRDKVFNTIITGYNTVKTAVVERND